MSDVYARVGRGGAGNWYSKQDVQQAEKEAKQVSHFVIRSAVSFSVRTRADLIPPPRTSKPRSPPSQQPRPPPAPAPHTLEGAGAAPATSTILRPSASPRSRSARRARPTPRWLPLPQGRRQHARAVCQGGEGQATGAQRLMRRRRERSRRRRARDWSK